MIKNVAIFFSYNYSINCWGRIDPSIEVGLSLRHFSFISGKCNR